MCLVIEGVGVGQLDAISHALVESDTLEVEVPTAHIWRHVEAHEPAGQMGLETASAILYRSFFLGSDARAIGINQQQAC